MHRYFWIATLVFIAFVPPAQAEQASPYSPTFDMQLPARSVAYCPGSLSLGFNPAGLGFGPSFEMLYLGSMRLDQLINEDNADAGQAHGLLLQFGKLGLGIQYVRPYPDDNRFNYLKYTVGGVLFQHSWFSLGYGLEILDPTHTAEDASVDFMAGVLIRPWRYISVGLVGRNLGEARIADQEQSHRTLDLGLAVRPLWMAPEKITLAVDYRLVSEVDDPPIRFTGNFSILDGVGLFGTVDLDGNFGAGFTIDFQRIGAGSYIHFNNKSEVEPDNLLLMARVSNENYPGFILSKEKTAEFILDNQVAANPQEAAGLFHSRPTFLDVEKAITQATEDERIDSILIRVQNPQMGWTDVQELRESLANFKSSGKKVFFHLQVADNLSYYLASIGDAIYLATGSSFQVTGPKVEALFLRGTLDLLGIKAEAERVGKYKSAVELFINKEPSEPYREVMNSIADELSDQILKAIAESRRMTRDQVQALIDNGYLLPNEAKEKGLIDGVVDAENLDAPLEKELGHPPRRKEYLSERWYQDRWGRLPTIAVVYATGTIVYGERTFGSSLEARQIQEILAQLRANSNVDAVILRVDSPGGSGMASELIWQEVKRLKEQKPVIVSMGNVAASGGYYISSPADAIVANPATITGSIGVLTVLFDLSELYRKIGIGHEVVKRGKLADIHSSFRGRTSEELAILKRTVEGFYQGFVERVSDDRKMKPEEVEAIAQGRVWTGRQAKEKGLLDELGGLERAIALTKQKIGLGPDDKVQLLHLPRGSFSLGMLLKEFGIVTAETTLIPRPLQETFSNLSMLASFGSESTLAILPFILTIR